MTPADRLVEALRKFQRLYDARYAVGELPEPRTTDYAVSQTQADLRDAIKSARDALAAYDAAPRPQPLSEEQTGVMQLPPLTDLMYHACRGSEYEFSSGGPETITGYLDDSMLDEIWEQINTALRVASNRAHGITAKD